MDACNNPLGLHVIKPCSHIFPLSRRYTTRIISALELRRGINSKRAGLHGELQ